MNINKKLKAIVLSLGLAALMAPATMNAQINRGLLENPYKDNSNKKLDTTYIVLGDTVYLAKFTFRAALSRTMTAGAGSSVKWFVPCEDIVSHEDENGFTTVPVFNILSVDCKDNGGKGEQEISSSRLIPMGESEGGTFRLIAESRADPLKRDTLAIIVQ
jgi:hypothetical protein